MTEGQSFFFVKDQNGGYQRINPADILFVKSLGNYLQIYCMNGGVTIHGSLHSLEKVFEGDSRFMRVHRSFLVNLDKVERIAQDGLSIKEHIVPVSGRNLERLKAVFIEPHLIKI